jgi:hypothetical protein
MDLVVAKGSIGVVLVVLLDLVEGKELEIEDNMYPVAAAVIEEDWAS